MMNIKIPNQPNYIAEETSIANFFIKQRLKNAYLAPALGALIELHWDFFNSTHELQSGPIWPTCITGNEPRN